MRPRSRPRTRRRTRRVVVGVRWRAGDEARGAHGRAAQRESAASVVGRVDRVVERARRRTARAATSAPRHAERLERKAAERPLKVDAGEFRIQTLNVEFGVQFAKSELELGIQSSKIPTLNSQIAARRLR